MRITLTLIGFIISMSIFGQSGKKIYETFEKSFKENSELSKQYEISNYLKPQFLVSDFNGDKAEDIAVLIINKVTDQRGFIIFHPNTNDFFVIGAGKIYNEEDKWDDLDWVDFWKINTTRKNGPGVQGGSNLILQYDSIKITKDEVGGGLIYWDGTKYSYFHQTC